MVKTYLVTVKLSDDATIEDIKERVPSIMATIQSVSKNTEVAFRSFDSSLFGVLTQSDKPLPVIKAAFDRCWGMLNKDAYWIVEVGPETLASQGFSRAMTWVQRRQ